MVVAATFVSWALFGSQANAAAPTLSAVSVSEVGTSSAKLEARLNPQGKATRYHFEYGPEACPSLANPCTSVPLPEGEAPSGGVEVPVSFVLKGLPAGTLFHVRLVAKHPSEGSAGVAEGPDGVFATYSEPLTGLPDERSFEQSSPVNKNGDDAEGTQAIVKASPSGDGITFLSTFGIPGGVGAQAQPTYLASRDAVGWLVRGLLPPATLGEGAQVLGWLPDFSVTYSSATRFSKGDALFAQPQGQSPVPMTPYVEGAGAGFAYVDATRGGAVVFFESHAKLPLDEGTQPVATPIEGASNLYAWDRESGKLSLVSVLNEESSPPGGSFAGPYDWARGNNGLSLNQGGARREYYLQNGHVVTPDGDIYFTTAGAGQLYLRENPTQPQSAMEGEECLEEDKACTVHVSASKRTSGPDTAGPQPAAFQTASADGESAFFISSEMLTDDANTGPEQPLASIVRDTTDGTGPIEAEFIPKHAVGLAEDSEYIYWADPVDGTIGRAKLNGEEVKDAFIAPASIECEAGVFEASKPRYVAVDSGHIYWTNTGCVDVPGESQTEGRGSIGRADIDGEAASVEPAFIAGRVETSPGKFTPRVTDPQGIAVSADHIYWANDPYEGINQTIARAAIGGGTVETHFATPHREPFGVTVSAGYVYFTSNAEAGNLGYVSRVPLEEGGAEEQLLIGEGRVRGVAVDGAHIYWASQSEGAIGRAGIGDVGPGECGINIAGCERKFIEVNGVPAGLFVDATHLHWSVNGETPANPGNDLYRSKPFASGGTLTDLTPDAAAKDGAEVQGVLGASADGSYVYFAANGDLDGTGPASSGDCHSAGAHGPQTRLSGHCNLYLWHEGTTSLVARLDASGGEARYDALDWTPTPGAGNAYLGRTARVSEDGRTLLFRSQEKLTAYENEGVPELYLYRDGDPEPVRCVSCRPSGEAPGEGPRLEQIDFPANGLVPQFGTASVLSRNLSGDGSRVFFETPESLSPADTNGEKGCPFGDYPACTDVYEWEAPGTGNCNPSTPSYSPLDRGCVYLISTGKDNRPSLFGDASETGKDVFFFTFQQLVGQDQDELRDVYDARVEGGLPSQNPPPKTICDSAEACHGPAQQLPAEATPATPGFQGPSDPKPKRRKKAKHHQKRHSKPHRKAGAGRRAGK